jgi:3-oxoacid CoA-transferase B subunit
MDLVAGARQVRVITDHVTSGGEPKLFEQCSYPLTGRGVVERIYTNLAVLDVTADGFLLREVAPGVSIDRVRELTAAPLQLDPACAEMEPPAL